MEPSGYYLDLSAFRNFAKQADIWETNDRTKACSGYSHKYFSNHEETVHLPIT